jgi:hypothetical protein
MVLVRAVRFWAAREGSEKTCFRKTDSVERSALRVQIVDGAAREHCALTTVWRGGSEAALRGESHFETKLFVINNHWDSPHWPSLPAVTTLITEPIVTSLVC